MLINPANFSSLWFAVSKDKLLADTYQVISGFDFLGWVAGFKTVLQIITVIFAVLLAIIIYKIRGLVKERLLELKTEIAPPGESMGERLMLIQPGQLLALQLLWDAHKLRNLLVHAANYQLTHRQAIMA